MFKRIQLLMMSHGMKKVDFAKAVGVSSGNLSDWSNGRSQPSVDKLIKIADYFNVSLDYLVGRDADYPSLSPDANELCRIYENLDAEGRTIVLGQAYLQKQRMAQAEVNEQVKAETEEPIGGDSQ